MKTLFSRRKFIQHSALLTAAGVAAPFLAAGDTPAAQESAGGVRASIAPGPFQPNWESLAQNYRCPDWFRDAKFGIWAHWSAQCVPEQGDWYARRMYLQGDPAYDYHVKTYGHPSKFGFMQIDRLWRAEQWEPEKLMDLYVRAGAKYFMSLANHHDNFDCYDSKYHAWNSVKVGPKKDIVGTWAKIARERGLRFGVSNHSAHAWHWFQVAYGYDGAGPLAGVRYDAYTLKRADGKGLWWEDLDPQELYTGRNIVIPDGIRGVKAVQEWHEQHDRPWTEDAPLMNPEFTRTWFLRCRDLVDKYQPDLVYFDDIGSLPLGEAGLDIAAHYYNANIALHGGKLEGVITVKGLDEARRTATVPDYERGVANGIQALPWQTDTCIGDWHYSRRIAENNWYKTVPQVVQMLADIVSKNGNLMLNIPVRGNGTIDEHEVAFLQGLGAWMDVNGEAIFGTRPWKTCGEGPTRERTGMFAENNHGRYTSEDVRFTAKNGALYAIVLAWPSNGLKFKSLGTTAGFWGQPVASVKLLGSDETLQWSRTADALVISQPKKQPNDFAVVFKIT